MSNPTQKKHEFLSLTSTLGVTGTTLILLSSILVTITIITYPKYLNQLGDLVRLGFILLITYPYVMKIFLRRVDPLKYETTRKNMLITYVVFIILWIISFIVLTLSRI